MNARTPRQARWLGALPVLAVVLIVAPRAGADAGVGCGSTLTADTTLTANLRCSGDGLVVTGAGVTLDLAGHSLSGDGTGSGITIAGAHVTVTNGVVAHFRQGVDVERGGDQATLTRLTARKNGTGLAVGLFTSAGATQGLVSDSELTNSDLDGVFPNGTFWTIEDTTIAHNGRNGVFGYPDAFGQTIVGSRINDNAGDGISLTNQNDNSKIAGNVASQNGRDGIDVDTSTAQVTGNTTRANGGTGIWVNEEAGLAFGPFYLIAANTSTANLGFGIRSCIFVDPLHRCEAGMVDGGGNVARANQLTPECVNVVCARHS
jgi:parallel beta-helix repeat protein